MVAELVGIQRNIEKAVGETQKRSNNHETFFNGLLKNVKLVDLRIRVSQAYR